MSPPKLQYAIALHGGAGRPPASPDQAQVRRRGLSDALSAGSEILKAGGLALDAVEEAIRLLEDSQAFNAGQGAQSNTAGQFELDASIMDGRTRACGAVGCVRSVRNPISLARRVMTDTSHILLVGDGAEAFARSIASDPKIDLAPGDYFTARAGASEARESPNARRHSGGSVDTVGCVALDRDGNLAAGASTGGLAGKRPGRLGDSPLVGAGLFADNEIGAITCTGVGEDFIRNVTAFDVAARIKYRGDSLAVAMQAVLHDASHPVCGGMIGLAPTGEAVLLFNTPGMARAAADSGGRWEIHVGE